MTEATARPSARRGARGDIAFAVTALVLLVAGLVTGARAHGDGLPFSEAPPFGHYTKDYVAPVDRDGLKYPSSPVLFGRFVDRSHGFFGVCRHSVAGACQVVIMATSDGGMTMTLLHTPDDPDDNGALWLYAFDRDHVVLAVQPELARPTKLWASRDAGASWREVATAPGTPVDRIPSGAQLIQTSSQILETLSADGSMHVLNGVPNDYPFNLFVLVPERYTGEIHGTCFVGFLNRTDQTAGAWVTCDHGASWQRTGLAAELLGAPVILGFDGWQYLALDRRLEASPDGITWRPIPMPAFIPIEWRPPVPYSQRFAPIPSAPGTKALLNFGGRVLAQQTDGVALLQVSTVDGSSWQPITPNI